MASDLEVLTYREASTMVSAWTEYLCLRMISSGRYVLEVCQYEPLAEYRGFDDNGKERQVPKMVNGKQVVGVEDGYLVGGELECSNDDMRVVLTDQRVEDVIELIEVWGFEVDRDVVTRIGNALG